MPNAFSYSLSCFEEERNRLVPASSNLKVLATTREHDNESFVLHDQSNINALEENPRYLENEICGVDSTSRTARKLELTKASFEFP